MVRLDAVRWQWSDTTSAPVLAATPVQFTRNFTVHGTGVNTILGITGNGNHAIVDILTTSDGINFTIVESATPIAKSGHTFNAALTQLWGVGDTWNPVNKMVKSESKR